MGSVDAGMPATEIFCARGWRAASAFGGEIVRVALRNDHGE